jgi:sterol desaturase/sphingolipid hydroxylase (fatty acid hydroxylase superfamily)
MWVVIMAGVAELFYHWNIKTPKWLGYIIQRPEQHDVHHERHGHRFNYGDLPVWDWLHGTYRNPETFNKECGFGTQLEQEFGAMLLCKDVGSKDRLMPGDWKPTE